MEVVDSPSLSSYQNWMPFGRQGVIQPRRGVIGWNLMAYDI